jgi:flagellar FliJ protein
MKKFVFKLERILKIKEHEEDIAKEQYAKVLQQKLLLEKEINEFNRDIENTINEESFNENNTLDYNSLTIKDNYIKSLNIKIGENKERIEEIEPNLERLKEELFQRTKDRKIFTKLREKDHQRYKEEIKIDEIKSIDDSANKAYIVNKFRGEGDSYG